MTQVLQSLCPLHFGLFINFSCPLHFGLLIPFSCPLHFGLLLNLLLCAMFTLVTKLYELFRGNPCWHYSLSFMIFYYYMCAEFIRFLQLVYLVVVFLLWLPFLRLLLCNYYMSYFAYTCKTEGKNGISRLISALCVNCLNSIPEYSRIIDYSNIWMCIWCGLLQNFTKLKNLNF